MLKATRPSEERCSKKLPTEPTDLYIMPSTCGDPEIICRLAPLDACNQRRFQSPVKHIKLAREKHVSPRLASVASSDVSRLMPEFLGAPHSHPRLPSTIETSQGGELGVVSEEAFAPMLLLAPPPACANSSTATATRSVEALILSFQKSSTVAEQLHTSSLAIRAAQYVAAEAARFKPSRSQPAGPLGRRSALCFVVARGWPRPARSSPRADSSRHQPGQLRASAELVPHPALAAARSHAECGCAEEAVVVRG